MTNRDSNDKRRMNNETINKIKQLYENTYLSKTDIAKECNCSIDCVAKYIKKLNCVRSNELQIQCKNNNVLKVQNTKLKKYGISNYNNSNKMKQTRQKQKDIIGIDNNIAKQIQILYETTPKTLNELSHEYNIDMDVINWWKFRYMWHKTPEYKISKSR